MYFFMIYKICYNVYGYQSVTQYVKIYIQFIGRK